ncbi:uncharacterized protein LOC125659401 isoform X1 [Ostrea edulis]|nr:uncharacterized protein LOC125659401 isoform X1 [Ostrea edulis]
MAFIAKQEVSLTPRQKVKGPKCGQCEEKKAAVNCVQCSEYYCPGCFAAFHLKGALKKHRSLPVSATGPRQCMSPRPTPPVTNGNRNYEIDSSENFESLPSDSAIHPANSVVNRVRFDDYGRNSPEGASGSFDGPSLFDGNYDESESAASFQQALAAWRSGKPEAGEPASEATRQPQVLKVETPRHSVPTGVDSGTETKEAPPVEIKFSSNLSYAERLLIKKHRRTDIEKSDTPRMSLPSTPRLNFSMPKDSHSEVEMPFTPRSQQTPRIEAYPQRAYAENEEQDDIEGELEERVNFNALYELAKVSSNTNQGRPRHDEDNISIIELDTITTNPTIEETTQFMVEESGDLEAWTVKDGEESVRETQRHNQTASIHRTASRTANSITASPENVSAKPPIRLDDRLGSAKVKTSSQSQSQSETRVKSGKVRPPSAKSRPPSSRAKSRQDSQRPASRTRSRAGSRMEGEGCLTKAPSEALSMVAQMSAEVKVQQSIPLEELFMIGVTPAQQDRVMTPSRAKSAKDDRMKVSNQLYQMAPRSWRPDSSLADNVPNDLVQIEPVEDPLAVPMETDAIDMIMDANSYHSNTEGIDDKTPTPRAPSRSDSLLRDSTLPEFTRNLSYLSTNQRSPEPPKEKNNRQASRNSKSRSSHLTPRAGSSRADPHNIAQPTALQSSATFDGCMSSKGVDQMGARASSRSGSGITPRPARASSRSGGMIPGAEELERPASRAIVVDGEDLSSYDTVGDQENRNLEDQESLSRLEWELASESGRVTADGQISRMSTVMPDTDDEGSTGSSRSFSRMSQQDQGYDINSRLREDELIDDEEERESEEENEVKALH